MTCLGATAFVINLWADARKARVPPPERRASSVARGHKSDYDVAGRTVGRFALPSPKEPVSMDG